MLEGLFDKLVLSANATDIFNKNKSIRWWPYNLGQVSCCIANRGRFGKHHTWRNRLLSLNYHLLDKQHHANILMAIATVRDL